MAGHAFRVAALTEEQRSDVELADSGRVAVSGVGGLVGRGIPVPPPPMPLQSSGAERGNALLSLSLAQHASGTTTYTPNPQAFAQHYVKNHLKSAVVRPHQTSITSVSNASRLPALRCSMIEDGE